MSKRILSIVIPVLILVLGAPAGAFASHASSNNDDYYENENGTNSSNPIEEGLCVGASLDFSESSQEECKEATSDETNNTPTRRYPSYHKNHNNGGSNNGNTNQRRYPSYDKSQNHNNNSYQNANDYNGYNYNSGQNNSNTRRYPSYEKHPGGNPSTQPRYPSYDKHHKNEQTNNNNSPTSRQNSGGNYAALGDSVAAGLGLSAASNARNASGEDCGRSRGAYPYGVAAQHDLQVNHIACTGATMGDLFTQQRRSGPNVQPQLARAFANGSPRLITITAGANDVHWDDFLRKCYTSTCGTGADEAVSDGLLTALRAKMQFVFRDIDRLSNGSKPKVILTGYYQPLSTRCSQVEPRITPSEIAWLNGQTDKLNQVLENGAQQSGYATFAPVNFSGHDICSEDPWVQGIDDPGPFHPNAEGQRAIAQEINGNGQ